MGHSKHQELVDTFIKVPQAQLHALQIGTAVEAARFIQCVQCPQGHRINYLKKDGLKWHQVYTAAQGRICDVCSKDIENKETCWRCCGKPHCDRDVCMSCMNWAAELYQATAAPEAASPAPAGDPALDEAVTRVTALMENRADLRQKVRQCWDAAGGGDGSRGLDINGLWALCNQVEAQLSVPASSFGNLRDTYRRFDFNGDGILDFEEAYRCVTCCLREWRKQVGGEPAPEVPCKTPQQAGYTVIKVLAAGGQGEATLVRDQSGQEVVLKSYSRANQNAGGIDELLSEADSMRVVERSPYIAHVYEIFQDDNNFYMVSAMNAGGDWASLRKKATEQGVAMTSEWFRALFKQAFEGLAHMHQNALMHCDIKEPNLMLKDNNYARPQVVIIDLGLVQSLFVHGQGPCGTPGYIPPETWSTGKWFPVGDVFSMGVVCFQLMANKTPDADLHQNGIFTEGCQSLDDVKQCTLNTPAPFEFLTDQSPALLQWLQPCLEKVKEQRLRAIQVVQCPWFQSVQAQQVLQAGMPTPSSFVGAPGPVVYAAPPQQVASVVRQAPVFQQALPVRSIAAAPQQYVVAPQQYVNMPTVAGAPQVQPVMAGAPVQYAAAPQQYVAAPQQYVNMPTVAGMAQVQPGQPMPPAANQFVFRPQ